MPKKIFIKLSLFVLLFFLIPTPPALAGYRVDVTLLDGNGDSITTALDLRISLWGVYDVRDGDIDENGNINTSATHYGGYQTTTTITPDEEGRFISRYNYGFYTIYTNNLTDFPEPVEINNVFLQLEYKDQGAPNTDYQVYDFVNDPPWQNVTRYLLVSNVSYFTYDAGPQTYYNTFVLDANNNAPTEIKLEFGETLAESLKWSKTNVRFELSDDLYIDGGLIITADLDFNLGQMVEARVENLSSAPACDANSKGRIYYNTTDNLIYFCNGTSWAQL